VKKRSPFNQVKKNEFTFFLENKTINYYEILNVDKSATQNEIKKGYRKEALKVRKKDFNFFQYHPDRNRGCGQECIDKMTELTEAYIILANPETRSFHDRFFFFFLKLFCRFGVKPPDHLIEIAKAKFGGRANQ
jgi:curved DNA-binding protein CbpA